MAEFPQRIMAKALVLNTLRHGPANRVELYTYGREHEIARDCIDQAAKWFRVIERREGDIVYWSLPTDRVHAIWWGRGDWGCRHRHSVMSNDKARGEMAG